MTNTPFSNQTKQNMILLLYVIKRQSNHITISTRLRRNAIYGIVSHKKTKQNNSSYTWTDQRDKRRSRDSSALYGILAHAQTKLQLRFRKYATPSFWRLEKSSNISTDESL